MNRRIFIVHGHDSTAMYELKDFIVSLGLEPIALFQQDDRGMAIIEKFEYYGATCDCAVVLLTPDDKVSAASGSDQWRSRQNVILEMGWFMHKVGRSRVILLHKGPVEIPSDILGVLYLEFNKSVYEVSEKIRQRLSGLSLL